MRLNGKNIFLLDGTGALMSAFSSGTVLPLFSQWLGLPHWILYALAVIGLACATYSLTCYFVAKESKRWMLSGIMLVNMLYGLLIGLLFVLLNELTIWGRAVLVVDAIIIATLVFIEAKVYRRTFSQPLVSRPGVAQ